MTLAERRAMERAARAMRAVLCESNGISDNIWRLKDGTEIKADWPWSSFGRALELANASYEEILLILGPDFNEYGEESSEPNETDT